MTLLLVPVMIAKLSAIFGGKEVMQEKTIDTAHDSEFFLHQEPSHMHRSDLKKNK